ncbi:MAG: hypothetical protein ACRDO8_10510 [Nocardioidaceae bacterium]
MSTKPAAGHRRTTRPDREALRRAPRSAGVAIIALGIWTAIGPWVLMYPFTEASNDKIMRAFILAVFVVCCGCYLFYVGSSPVASGICLVGGILFIVSAITFPHDVARVQANEIGTGALIVIAAVMSMTPWLGSDG